ncbi:MAG: HlyD family efflux transporter periplasmic adaptor subunit [Desulfovibrio desulfuricans]|jgi:multidrug efflux pump subunit AcrA (membrane-fusion protein)|nr:HlyD family efflux transporter periplasmic adaptor subunit [Desulfovibrio desulfuricans]
MSFCKFFRAPLRRVALATLASALVASFPAVAAAAGSGTILTGKVVTTVTRAIPLPFHAVVDEVLVKPGAPVSKGAPLLRYHLQDEAERALQREVTTGAGTENLRGQVLDLERQLAEAAAQRNKARQLAASGLGSAQASSRQENAVKSLRDRIELLRVTIDKQERNFALRLDELSRYFGTPIRAGETLPVELTLTSPIDGYVLSLDAKVNPGSLLPANSTPVSVGKLDPVLIQVPVYEAEVSGIKEGDAVEVELPSLNDRKFHGTVNEISWISNDMNVSNPSYYTVEVTVPNPDLELKPGFKAVVRFKGK